MAFGEVFGALFGNMGFIRFIANDLFLALLSAFIRSDKESVYFEDMKPNKVLFLRFKADSLK